MIGKEIPITVIMSVYNSEKYLQESIDSILKQTFQNFRFIIVNDGSTDNSENIIKSYQDNRIILINNSYNLGLTKSLNKALRLTKSKYIARMDSDDIALKDRLEAQYKYMELHKDVGVLGTQALHIYEGTNKRKFKYKCLNSREINSILLCNNPIIHPTVMLRNEILKTYEIKYNEKLRVSQDYGLWIEMSQVTKIENLPKILLHYRVSKGSITNTYKNSSIKRHFRLFKSIFKVLNYNIDDDETFNYAKAVYASNKKKDLVKLKNTIEEILLKSNNINSLDNSVLKKKLGFVWLKNIFKDKFKIRFLFSKITLFGIYYPFYILYKKYLVLFNHYFVSIKK